MAHSLSASVPTFASRSGDGVFARARGSDECAHTSYSHSVKFHSNHKARIPPTSNQRAYLRGAGKGNWRGACAELSAAPRVDNCGGLAQCSNAYVGVTSVRSTRPTQETSQIRRHTTGNVVGLGQAMVDFAASVEPEVLLELKAVMPSLDIDGRCCITAEERGAILNTLDGNSYKLNAGGSLSNTLVALSRLCAQRLKAQRTDPQAPAERSQSVSIACSLGSDPLGEFYRTQLKKADVQVLSEPGVDGTTGSVIVLTTPDAHRTMLSCWGTSATLEYDDAMDDAVANAQVLIVEGYLWEMPETIASIRKAMATAKRNNVTVAFTASDASCVERHRDEFWELLKSGDVDIFFANRAEALAMTNLAVEHKEEAVRLLAKHAELVVMTDGSHGSYLVRDEQLALVPPHWSAMKPVDTCGAGDAFAAGCLYGLLMGEDLRNIGRMGARVASVVISHTGARLSLADAELLMSEPLFSSTVQPLAVRSDPSNPLCVVPKSKENPNYPVTVDMENKLDFDRRA